MPGTRRERYNDPVEGRRARRAGSPAARVALQRLMSSFVAIDFETANEDRDSACAVAVAAGRDGRMVGSWSSRIRPPTPEFTFTYVHNLTWEDVREAPVLRGIWPELSRLLQSAEFVAAHNAPFDSSVLTACCRRYGLRPPAVPFQCTVQLARTQWRI